VTRVLLLAVMIAAAPLHAQRYRALMEKGAQADVRGKTIKAANRFEAAIAAAETPEQRVDARFAYIAATAGGGPVLELPATVVSEIEEQYRAVLPEATGVQGFKAHHDFALFLRGLNRAPEAIAVFAEGEQFFPSVSEKTRARYLFNAAQALLEGERYEEAFATMQCVLALDPALGPTAGKAFVILSRLPAERAAGEAVGIVELLLAHEELDLTRSALSNALDPSRAEWHKQADATSRLVSDFARWAFQSGAAFDDIVKNWIPRLQEAAANATSAEVQKVSELAALYANEEIPLSFEADYEVRFSHWRTPEEQKAISGLALLAGAAFLDQEAPARAAERMVASWRLDQSNVDPLIYLVSILNEWPEAPAGLLDEMSAAVFDREGLRGADFDALLRFHLTLGSMFEDLGQWGPRDVPMTAVYQYERALNAYVHIHDGDPATNFPGVHSRLANAYQHAGLAREAWEQYVYAASASLAQQEDTGARVMIEGAKTCGYTPTDDEAARLAGVLQELAKYPEPPSTDAALEEDVRAHLWANPEVAAQDLDVAVANGVVNLSFGVDDHELIEDATVATQSIEGVKDVKVEVTQATPPPR
jgi:tetratricopeptide (TPR) repeat protein